MCLKSDTILLQYILYQFWGHPFSAYVINYKILRTYKINDPFHNSMPMYGGNLSTNVSVKLF